jgi:hypothetical protein
MNSYLYALPVSTIVSTIIIGLSVGLIKISEYIQNCCVSNTKLIIRQNDQISFLLKRLVDLNNKIVKLELDFTLLSTKSYNDELIKDELIKDELIKDELIKDVLIKDELINNELINNELIKDELIKDELIAKEEVFEIIDATLTSNTTITSKKTGWFSF